MLILSLAWLVGGALIGLLVRAAALPPARPGGARWPLWRYALMGALAALVGGWLGTLLFGSLFGSPTAIWVGVLVTAAAPYTLGVGRWAAHRLSSAAGAHESAQ